MMGGGPETPAKHPSSEKELALVVISMPEERAQKGIEGLEAEFKDVEVKFFNPSKSPDIPEGMHRDVPLMLDLVLPSSRDCGLWVVPMLASNLIDRSRPTNQQPSYTHANPFARPHRTRILPRDLHVASQRSESRS
jgi:hypothetical protein